MDSRPQGVCRPHLTVAMIVRDEQDVLAETIDSARAIADEILVLDTGSNNETAARAQELGARVILGKWEDDFAAARNRLLEEVTGDWVLWLDAGERLEAESASQLRTFINRQVDPTRVYLIMVELPAADRNGSAEQAARPRLMPVKAGLRFSGRVCESLRPAKDRLGMEFDAAPGRIIRHARHQRAEVKASRARRDLRLIEREIAAHGVASARLLNARGEALADLGDPSAAHEAFLQALEAASHGSTEMLEAYYGLLTTFDGDPSRRDAQLKTCLEALEIYPLDAQLLVAMGGYLQAQNHLELASRAFSLAVGHGKVNLDTWHLGEIFEIAAACESVVLQLQGRAEDACRVLEESLIRSPDSLRTRRHLAEIYVRTGREEEALVMAEALAAAPDERKALCMAVHGACDAARQNWTSALAYLQSAYMAGCQDPLCLRWLTLTLLSSGQTDAARPVIDEWLAREPNHSEALAFKAAIEQYFAGAGQIASQEPEEDSSRYLRLDPAQSMSGMTLPGSVILDCMPPMDPAPNWAG